MCMSMWGGKPMTRDGTSGAHLVTAPGHNLDLLDRWLEPTVMPSCIQVWVAPVNAIEPQTGLHIWWDGLWMERAPGISLNQLSYITRKTFVQDTIQVRLNK